MPERQPKPAAIRFLARHWFVTLVLVSLVLHVVVLAVARPWAKTTMVFDERANAERAELVRARELARRELERERRQKIRLTPEQAEQLREREKARREHQLRENVRRLRASRDQVMRDREEAFDRLEQRTEAQVLRDKLRRLELKLDDAVEAARELTKESEFGDGPKRLRNALLDAREKIEALRAKADADPDTAGDYAATAKRLTEDARRWADQYDQWQAQEDGSEAERAEKARAASEEVADAAAELADGLDMAALNDTEAAPPVGDPPAAAEPGQIDRADAAELYDAAVALERQTVEADRQARAAELAQLNATSMADAMAGVEAAPPARPDLAPTLRQGEASRASAREGSDTVGELNAYREAFARATSESQDMARRAARRAEQPMSPTQAAARAAAESQGQGAFGQMSGLSRTAEDHEVVNLVPLQLASHSGSGSRRFDLGLEADMTGLGDDMPAGRQKRELHLNNERVVANALPGRMLTEQTDRSGFLYLDTWYIIGPWENHAETDFETAHPPEQRIDLDAAYDGGKFAGDPDHPYHELRWKFVQSDRIAISPPDVFATSTYYGFTEVYSDRTRDVLIAVASDDMAKVWLNGQPIWTDSGQSAWSLDEGFRRVLLQKGFNRVLVRIENGPGRCAFSVLLCPPSVLAADD